MPNREVIDLPAAERLQRIIYKIRDIQEAEKKPETITLHEMGVCVCNCHIIGPAGNKTRLTRFHNQRPYCSENCLACIEGRHKFVKEQLEILHKNNYDSCCLEESILSLTIHLTSIDHLAPSYRVAERDIQRLETAGRAVPQMWDHPELWIPLMKASYGFGMAQNKSVLDIRVEFIARQLIASVEQASGKAALFRKPLFPSRVMRQENSKCQDLGNYGSLSPTGFYMKTDAPELEVYKMPGKSQAQAFWGEGE